MFKLKTITYEKKQHLKKRISFSKNEIEQMDT
jgi:hypothetical protein